MNKFIFFLLIVTNLLLQCKCDLDQQKAPTNRPKRNAGSQSSDPKSHDPDGGASSIDPNLGGTPPTDPTNPGGTPPTDPTNPGDTPPTDPTNPGDTPPSDPNTSGTPPTDPNTSDTPPTDPNPDGVPSVNPTPPVDTAAIDQMIKPWKNANAAILVDVLQQIKAGRKASINQQYNDHEDVTALNLAIGRGHKDTIKFLLENGADANIPNQKGEMPLYKAANIYSNPKEIMELLVAHGADINAKDKSGNSLLHQAIKKNNNSAVEKLLEFKDKKLNINIQNDRGYTPLHELVMHRKKGEPYWFGADKKLAEKLLGAGADPKIKTINEEHAVTPLHDAAIRNDVAMIEVLIQHGAELDAEDIHGYTPFNMAIREHKWDAAEKLLEKGAKIDAPDKQGHTPLAWAQKNNRQSAVKFLTEQGAK